MLIIIRNPASHWSETLSASCRERSPAIEVHALALPRALAPSETGETGEPQTPEAELTIDGERVLWNGLDLCAAGAIFVERPLFSWPQTEARDATAGSEREARALSLSALQIASEHTAIAGGPRAAHWAAHPVAALDELAEQGLAIHPWRLAEVPEEPERARLDPIGRPLGHDPQPPRPGDLGRVLQTAPALPFWRVLVIGDAAIAGRIGESEAELGSELGSHLTPQPELPPAAAQVAERACAALDLGCCAVTVAADERVLDVEAAPDWAAWDAASSGTVRAALANHLLATASRGSSTPT